MTELAPRQAAIVHSIVTAPLAWSSLAVLRRRGHRANSIKALEGAGWIERWARARDGRALNRVCCTLSPWAADRLGLEIVEEGPNHRPRWARRGEDREPERIERQTRTVSLRLPGFVADGRPEYLADVITGEVTTDEAAAEKILGVPVRRERRKRPRGRPAGKRTSRQAFPGRVDWALKHFRPAAAADQVEGLQELAACPR
jgi:hypothetical protein